MKTLNTIFIVLTLIFVSNSYAQTQPDMEKTFNYLESKFFELNGYTIEYSDGGVFTFYSDVFTNYRMKFRRIHKTEHYRYENIYEGINYAKLISIKENVNDDLNPNSPIKRLELVFINNSIKFRGYLYGANNSDWDRYSNGVVQSFIPFYYRDEPGEKEKVIKAILHLSKLFKEKQAKNDPFGN